MRRTGSFPLSLFLLGLIAAPVVPAANGDDPVDSGYEEQVSVTASRTPIPINETGNSVTVLTREEIEERGHAFLADLLRGIPGLAIARSGPAGALTEFRVRGAEANHVLVRIDGVDVSDMFGADVMPFEILTTFDIERIEFVRGPQSGLWGSDAVAGVIDIVTRPAEGPSSSARVETGSFGTLSGGGRLDLGSDAMRFDIGVSHLESDGTNISRQGTENDGTRNTTASAGLRVRPRNSRLSFELTARHTDSESDFDDIDSGGTGLPTDADNVTETDLSLVRAQARWAGESSRWRHEFAVFSAASDVATTLSGTPSSSTEIDKTGATFQSSVELGRPAAALSQRLTLALDHEQRDFSQRGMLFFGLDPNQDQELDNTGLAVEYRVNTADRWAVSAAVRHEDNSDFENVTTFRLTGSFGFDDGKTRVRAAVGTGQKAPTFIERFGFFPGSFLGNPDLRPEESKGFEVGVDRLIGKRARFSVTYFNDTLEDEIDGVFYDANAGTFTAVNRDGESDRQGVEIEFETAIGERADIRGSYTYTDAQEPDASGAMQRERRRPEDLASLAAHWRSAAGRTSIRAGLNHTGSTTDLFFPPFPQPSDVVDLESYLLADVNITVRVARQLEWFVRGENLLDENYEDVYGFRNSGIAGYTGLVFRREVR